MGIYQTDSTDNQKQKDPTKSTLEKLNQQNSGCILYRKKVKGLIRKNSLQYSKSVDSAEVRGERRHRNNRRPTKSFTAIIAI